MAVAAPSRTITERSAVDLARAIRERELSAREVVEAHRGWVVPPQPAAAE